MTGQMSMIERVAKAIYDADHAYELKNYPNTFTWEKTRDAYSDTAADYRARARAAVEAMREPTEAMAICLAGYEESDEEKVEGWNAAIDAALSEK